MRSKRPGLLRALSVLAMIVSAGGCVTSSTAPDDFLVPVEETGRHAYGGWIELSTNRPDRLVIGELLAVHDDSVFVLGRDVIAIARPDVVDAEMFAYNARFGRLAGWSSAGVLGTLSHGLFLVVTGPVWIITGTAAAGIQSREPRLVRSNNDSWNAFRLYSRFPAGLPAEARALRDE